MFIAGSKVVACSLAATLVLWLALSSTVLADDKTFVMKIALATVNDPLHQFAEKLCRRDREGFGRPHQGRDLSGEPIGFRPSSRPRACNSAPFNA